VVTLAAARGIGVVSMDWCSQRDPGTANGLVLGYGNLADSTIDEGVAMLAAIVAQAEIFSPAAAAL
jgi:DNA-binding transcriptional MocR family regulator